MKKNWIIFLCLIWTSFSNQRNDSDLSIGFWNVENLFDLENDPDKRDDEFSLNGRKKATKEIYDLKIKNSAEVLYDLNVDVLGLCEVENRKVLNDLNNSYRSRNYSIIHYDSPDERGIDNALLYDKDKFSIITSKPIQNNLGRDDKTRDILYVKGLYKNSALHIFVNHWPSNYGGKELAIPKRKSTALLIMQQISEIQKNENNAEIILLGDFNEDPTDENVTLLYDLGFVSLMEPMIGIPKTGTYLYRGKDYFYDQIIINKALNEDGNLKVINKSIYILDLPKYRQQEGKYKRYPYRFWAGNRLLGGYSDHLAIKINIRKVTK